MFIISNNNVSVKNVSVSRLPSSVLHCKTDYLTKIFKIITITEPCPGLVDYVMIWIIEPFIKNEKSTKDVLISWVNKT